MTDFTEVDRLLHERGNPPTRTQNEPTDAFTANDPDLLSVTIQLTPAEIKWLANGHHWGIGGAILNKLDQALPAKVTT